MHNKYKRSLDKTTLTLLAGNLKRLSDAKQNRALDPTYSTVMPESIAVKLTNRCNMRCGHCYQWNETGHNHYLDKDLQNGEITVDLMRRLLEDTEENKARFYLWGGEPLMHSGFDELADLFVQHPREVTLCTNGTLIPQKIESVCKLDYRLEVLVAVEGFEEEHDAIRGEGSFKRVMDGIDLLLKLRSIGTFHGKVYLHTMINDKLIPHIYNYLCFCEEKGVDYVVFCFPWYISPETTTQMDAYFVRQFSWLDKRMKGQTCSWHAYNYKLSADQIPVLSETMQKIKQKKWSMAVRFQPDLTPDQMECFVAGDIVDMHRYSSCLALSYRIDVGPDGSTSACKQFFEFYTGNLYDEDLRSLWKGEAFEKIRKTIGNQLMPVCSKCSNLYVHGI